MWVSEYKWQCINKRLESLEKQIWKEPTIAVPEYEDEPDCGYFRLPMSVAIWTILDHFGLKFKYYSGQPERALLEKVTVKKL